MSFSESNVLNSNLYDKVFLQDNAIQFQGKDSASSFVVIRNGATILFNDGREPIQGSEEEYETLLNVLQQQSLVSDKVVKLEGKYTLGRGTLPQLNLENATTGSRVLNFLGSLPSLFSRTENIPTAPVVATVETPVATGIVPPIATVRASTNAIASILGTPTNATTPSVQSNFQNTNFASAQSVPTQIYPEMRPLPQPTQVNSNQYSSPCSTQRASYRASTLSPGKLQEIRAKDALRKRRSRECRKSRGLYPW